jgi:hypothetical protein
MNIHLTEMEMREALAEAMQHKDDSGLTAREIGDAVGVSGREVYCRLIRELIGVGYLVPGKARRKAISGDWRTVPVYRLANKT